MIPTEEIVERTRHLGGWHVCRLILGENYESAQIDGHIQLLYKISTTREFLIFFVNEDDDFSYANQSETSLAADDVFKSRQRAALSFSESGERWSEDSVPVKAHLKPVDAIEWTPRDDVLKISAATNEVVLVKLSGADRRLYDLLSRFLTFPIYTDVYVPNPVWRHAWILLEQMAFKGDIEMMEFVERVEDVWRPLMRPVPTTKVRWRRASGAVRAFVPIKIRLGYPKQMNRLVKQG